MGWNPYTDQRNRAYSGILTSLFPEQTKTVSRIIVWSFIFLLDLILGVVGAAYFGLLDYGGELAAGLVLAAIVGIFWLQGRIWYAIVRFFQKNELD